MSLFNKLALIQLSFVNLISSAKSLGWNIRNLILAYGNY